MLPNPPDPILESIDGNTYVVTQDYPVKFGYWLRSLQFAIPAGTTTDLASIPWWLRSIRDRASLGILAPVVHDYLCDVKGKIITLQGESIQLSRFDAHLLFLILLRLDGISWRRSLVAFVAVAVANRGKW